MNFVKNETLKLWILWKIRFWNSEFCQKWDLENVNLVKIKLRLWNWVSCQKWDFQYVNFWINCGFLFQWAVGGLRGIISLGGLFFRFHQPWILTKKTLIEQLFFTYLYRTSTTASLSTRRKGSNSWRSMAILSIKGVKSSKNMHPNSGNNFLLIAQNIGV